MATFKIVQETEGSWTGPETAIVRGVNIPKARLDQSFREEDLDDFQTRKDDVFVVSYPKSGKYRKPTLPVSRPPHSGCDTGYRN